MDKIFALNPMTIGVLVLAGVVAIAAFRADRKEKIFYRILYALFFVALFLIGAVIFLALFFQVSAVIRSRF